MLKKLSATKSSFNELKKKITASINEKEAAVEKIVLRDDYSAKNKEEYDFQKILAESITTVIWDKKDFPIVDKEKLSELKTEIREVEFFSRDFEFFQKEMGSGWAETHIENKTQLSQFLFLESNYPELQSLNRRQIFITR